MCNYFFFSLSKRLSIANFNNSFMPLEIKELVVNTSINQKKHSDSNNVPSTFSESYLRELIKDELAQHKNKIIIDCIDKLNEHNRLVNQR